MLEAKPKYDTFDFDQKIPYEDLQVKLDAMNNTVSELEKHGANMDMPDEGIEDIADVLESYADDPEKASKEAVPKLLDGLAPAAVKMAKNVLDVYGITVAENMTHVKNVALNNTLAKVASPNESISLKATEMLCRMKDVGLFIEKTEVTITHQTSDELRDMLKEKIALAKTRKSSTYDGLVIEEGVVSEVNSDESTIAANITKELNPE